MSREQIKTIAVSFGRIFCSLSLIFMATACSKEAESAREVLGVIVPLSGPSSSMGVSIQRSLQLLNLRGIELQFEDDQCSPKHAVSAYRRLRQKGVKFFYLACSGSVLALAPLAKTEESLIITAYASSAAIRNTGPEVIRYVPDAFQISQEMAGFLRKRDSAKIGLLFEEQEYASNVASLVADGLGGRVSKQVSYTAGSGDYRAELLRLIGSKVDLLVLVPTAKESLALIYRQMAELNWLPVLVGDVNLCDYQPLPTDFGLRGYCWRAVLDTEGFFSFVEKFEKRYQEAPQFPYYDALTYDSVSLLDRALMNLGPKATATEVAQHLLAGGVGSITSYQFEPNGEILGGGNFLKKIEF